MNENILKEKIMNSLDDKVELEKNLRDFFGTFLSEDETYQIFKGYVLCGNKLEIKDKNG